MKLMKNSSLEDHLDNQKKLEHWFQTPLGRQLLKNQRQVVHNQIGQTFGNHQIEFLVSHRLPIASSGNISHRVTVISQWENDLPDNVLVALPHEVPLPENTADLIVLHHSLDMASQPHQTLRDVCRVLRSGGHLVVIGFNPVSFWGVRKIFNQHDAAPWCSRFISSKRIEDWLALLDFKINKSIYSFYQMPLQRWANTRSNSFIEGFCRRFRLPLGAYYCIVAQKQIGASIAVKPRWKTAKVIGMPVANGLSKNALFTEDLFKNDDSK